MSEYVPKQTRDDYMTAGKALQQNNRSGIMAHLNGNCLCAVDVETTGVDPSKHDIVQICILPLDHRIEMIKEMTPFYMTIKPRRPDNVDLSAFGVNKLADVINNGEDPYKAIDLLETWFEKKLVRYQREGRNYLVRAEGKRISPLAQNWPFDRSFLIDWLGPKTFNYMFDGIYRDTMVAATYANDKADWQGETWPYHHVNLTALARAKRVGTQARFHDAMEDCRITAEVYRRMLMDLSF